MVCRVRRIFRNIQTGGHFLYLSALSQGIDDGQTSSGLPLNRLSGAAGLVLIVANRDAIGVVTGTIASSGILELPCLDLEQEWR